jgi:hypothetical protein
VVRTSPSLFLENWSKGFENGRGGAGGGGFNAGGFGGAGRNFQTAGEGE